MKITHIIKCLFLLFIMQNCKDSLIESKNKQTNETPVNKSAVAPLQTDSFILINGHKLQPLKPKDCEQISEGSISNDYDFLHTFIRCFNSDTIMISELNKQDYFQKFLTGTQFLNFLPSDFKKENCVFTVHKVTVKGYGKCYVGHFKLLGAANAAQGGAAVIINIDKNEISVWDFYSIKFVNNILKIVFNLRGNHTLYDMSYSKECGTFIPL